MEKRLYRSRSNRMIWGICGGLAEYFGIDPTIIRIIAVLLVLANGLGILAYIILAIVVPLEGSRVTTPKETIEENVEEMKETASGLEREIRSTFGGEKGKPGIVDKADHRHLHIFGIILIIIGIILLLGNFNLLWWLRSSLWPLIIVAIGLLIIVGAKRK